MTGGNSLSFEELEEIERKQEEWAKKQASKNSNSISPKSQLSKDNLSTCGVDEKQQE